LSELLKEVPSVVLVFHLETFHEPIQCVDFQPHIDIDSVVLCLIVAFEDAILDALLNVMSVNHNRDDGFPDSLQLFPPEHDVLVQVLPFLDGDVLQVHILLLGPLCLCALERPPLRGRVPSLVLFNEVPTSLGGFPL